MASGSTEKNNVGEQLKPALPDSINADDKVTVTVEIAGKNKRKKNITLAVIAIMLILFVLFCLYFLYDIGFFTSKAYPPDSHGIAPITSSIDYNENGIDDYTDILKGAKAEAKARPKYKSAYYEGGNPPANEGVCTDLFWRALENAGYSLKALIDSDIADNIDLYPAVKGSPDPNIDYRRVKNIKVFLDRRTTSLTTDLNQKDQWQPGDIVVFGDSHIAIVSDLRNEDGIPFIIHSYSRFQLHYEEDAIGRFNMKSKITGHYRWDLR